MTLRLTVLGTAVLTIAATSTFAGVLLLAAHEGEQRRCNHLRADNSPLATYYCGPQTATGDAAGEDATPVVDDTTPAAGSVVPRPQVSKASRSRSLDRNAASGTPLSLSVTCYVATGDRTASGKTPQAGMAASNAYPFGTRLLIKGYGVVTVEDRIGHGSDLDLFMDDLAGCRRFGRQQLAVEVVR